MKGFLSDCSMAWRSIRLSPVLVSAVLKVTNQYSLRHSGSLGPDLQVSSLDWAAYSQVTHGAVTSKPLKSDSETTDSITVLLISLLIDGS